MPEMDRWFGVVTAKVALNPDISPSAKAVYLVLAMYADRGGACYPSNTTLSRNLGVSRDTVKRGVAELVRAGVIERQQRFTDGRQTTAVTVLLDVKAIGSAPPGVQK